MKKIFYSALSFLCIAQSTYGITRSDIIAINRIEKEIAHLLQTRPDSWLNEVEARINQLDRVYVPKGYQKENVLKFKSILAESSKNVVSEKNKISESAEKPFSQINSPLSPSKNISPQVSYDRDDSIQSSVAVQQEQPEIIMSRLDTVVPDEHNRNSLEWQTEVNKDIFALALTDTQKAKEYFEKIYITPKTQHAFTEEALVKESDPIIAVEETPAVTVNQPHDIKPKNIDFDTGNQLPKKPRDDDSHKDAVRQEETEEKANTLITIPEPSTKGTITVTLDKDEKKIHIVDSTPKKVLAPEEEEVFEKDDTQKKVHLQLKDEPEEAKKSITQKLDTYLLQPATQRDREWESTVNNSIFDLAAYDKEKANQYIAQVYTRTDTIPAGGVGVPVTVPSLPLPPANLPVPKPGGPPPPMPPKGPIVPKTPVITLGSLRKMEEQALVDLFEKHLNDLEKNWNERVEKREEIPTKYGKKVVIVRGAPELGWNNTLSTIKKVLIEKNKEGFSEQEITQRIDDRITTLREEKSKRPVSSAEHVEQAVQEESLDDLEKQLQELFEAAKTTELSWIVSVKSAIKKIDAFDHAIALKYQEEYIQLMPKEKRFIKP